MDSQFERFKKYMDAPCTELHEKDAGRGDAHRVAFKEWGVPQEFLLWIWQAAEAVALERAAQVCASYSVDKWNLYKGRAPYDGSESGRANPYVEGQSDGTEECAAAIRKLAVERGGE